MVCEMSTPRTEWPADAMEEQTGRPVPQPMSRTLACEGSSLMSQLTVACWPVHVAKASSYGVPTESKRASAPRRVTGDATVAMFVGILEIKGSEDADMNAISVMKFVVSKRVNVET